MVTPPYGSSAGGAQRRGRCRHRPLRPAGGREGGTPGSSCPTGGCGEPPRLPWPAAHSGAFAPALARDGWESEQRSSPKCSATSDNPSVSLRLTAPFTQGSLWDGDADCRVASLLAMTVRILCHSEEAQRADVGIRPFYDGRGVRAAEVVGPYGRSTEVPATGRCRHRPLRKAQSSTTQTSRRAAKRPRPRGRGMGGNWRKDHPQKGGTAPTTAGAALSEAESAGIAAGQIRSLPDNIRVQHGAQGSEASAKPCPCLRRCYDN